MENLHGLGARNATLMHPIKADERSRQVALQFETMFIAEMLTIAGLGSMAGEFSGGVGETQFSSLLTQNYAKSIASGKGLGVAEQIFATMTQKGM